MPNLLKIERFIDEVSKPVPCSHTAIVITEQRLAHDSLLRG